MEVYLTKMILNPRSRKVRRDVGNCQQLHRTISNASSGKKRRSGCVSMTTRSTEPHKGHVSRAPLIMSPPSGARPAGP